MVAVAPRRLGLKGLLERGRAPRGSVYFALGGPSREIVSPHVTAAGGSSRREGGENNRVEEPGTTESLHEERQDVPIATPVRVTS